MILIRPEKPEDYRAIYGINKSAFKCEFEARLVNNLRKTEGFIPELSLVAVKDGLAVGYILFSIIQIKSDSESVPVLSLAPMAVLPEYQRQGIGSRLIRGGIKKCKALGHKVIIVVGHHEYYSRFGFSSAKKKGLKLPFDIPEEAFMVYEIIPQALKGIVGTVIYPPEFAEE